MKLRFAGLNPYISWAQGIPRFTPILCEFTEIKPGLYVISVMALYDRSGIFRYLERLEPRERIGYTMHVYDVTEASIERLHLNEVLTE